MIEWFAPLGTEFVGHGKITGQGVTRYEEWGKPPMSNVSYHFGTAQNVQIGDGNVMNVAAVAEHVAAAIEASGASPAQKAEAKSLWNKLTNNQTFAAIVGAVAGVAASAIKG